MNENFQNLPEEVRSWIGNQLFEHVPNNIVVVGKDFKVLAANENFKQVFGDPEGKFCYEVYKNKNTACENCMAARTFQDGKVRINDEVGFDRKGRPAHYVVHIAPVFDQAGNVIQVIEMSYDVTENKSLQREYNILFERVPCYVAVINRDLQIVKANEMLRNTFGDTLGEHCYEVYKNRSERCPDCPAMKTFADGKSCSAEQVGVTRDGNLTHYVVSTAPLSRSGQDFSHVIEMSVDVTDVHKLSEKLVRESYFNNMLIEHTMDALVAVDATGTVITFNPAAEMLFNVRARDIIGKSKGRRFLPREFRDTIKNRGTNLEIAETILSNSDGEEIPVRVSGSVIWNQDEVIGGAAYLQDLRKMKKLEKEKLENERLAAVGQTVAQLAHGIKNILTGLQGGMYVIKSGMRSGSEEKTSKGWSMLERNVERITELVKGFLNFSKGHVPKVKLIDPNEVAEDVFNLYHDATHRKGINLSFEPLPGIRKAHMDPEEMHTCIANLVSNAIDACETSENKECSIVLRVAEKGDMLFFEVSDTGCGMEYQIKSKVFTTFFTTKGLGGTGLGLMVTRKIVQEHGGSISVDSTPGQGSVFRIEFPRDRLPRPA